MKFLKLFILYVFVFGFLSISPLIFAEGVTDTNSTNLTTTVNIEEAKVISQNGHNLNLSFIISNREGLQADARYSIKLISETDKGQFLIDEKVYPELFNLQPNSSVFKEISYQAPSNLSGEYSILISVGNKSGFVFSLAFIGKVKFDKPEESLEILPESCFLTITGENSTQTYTLSQGVDVKEDEILNLNCTAISHVKSSVELVPNFEVTERSLYGDSVPQIGSDNKVISFKAEEKKVFSVILPNGMKPQAYDVQFYLKNDTLNSNKILSHYVIRGIGATILSANPDKDFYKKGENASLTILLSGRADMFPGSRIKESNLEENILKVSITDSKGKECAKGIEQSISLNTIKPETSLSLPIKSQCENPQIKISILEKDTLKILDEKIFTFISKSIPEKGFDVLKLIIAIIIVLIICIVIYINKRKNINFNKQTRVILPIFLFIILSLILAGKAHADTFTVGDENGINLNVIANLDKTYYSPGDPINLTISATVNACSNTSRTVKVEVSPSVGYAASSILINRTGGGGDNFYESKQYITPDRNVGNDIEIRVTFGSTVVYYTIPIQVTQNGVCSAASANQCSIGTVSNKTETVTLLLWSCSGVNGGNATNCEKLKTPVNAVCGYNNTCNQGTYEDVPDRDGYEDWNCNGLYNGTNVSCYKVLNPINGECSTAYAFGCYNGTFSSLPDNDTEQYAYWTCLGVNNGTDASCSYKWGPRNCSWSGWSDCTPCGGNGIQTRYVQVTANNGGNECVGEATQSCNIACSSDNPPTVPTIEGPSTLNKEEVGSFKLTSTDGEGERIRYGIDWDMDGIVEDWLPADEADGSFGYDDSGVSETFSRSWDSLGNQTFQFLAQDYANPKANNSAWGTYIVKILNPNAVSVDLTADPTTIYKGQTSTLTWVSKNSSTCTLHTKSLWDYISVNLNDSKIVAPLVTSTYNITCGHYYMSSWQTVSDEVKITVIDEYTGTWADGVCPSTCGLSQSTQLKVCTGGNGYCAPPAPTQTCPVTSACIGTCTNGATNPSLCTVGPDGKCLNGKTNPPACTNNPPIIIEI